MITAMSRYGINLFLFLFISSFLLKLTYRLLCGVVTEVFSHLSVSKITVSLVWQNLAGGPAGCISSRLLERLWTGPGSLEKPRISLRGGISLRICQCSDEEGGRRRKTTNTR